MIRRPPRSTLSSSSAASDVYKRQPTPHAPTIAPKTPTAAPPTGAPTTSAPTSHPTRAPTSAPTPDPCGGCPANQTCDHTTQLCACDNGKFPAVKPPGNACWFTCEHPTEFLPDLPSVIQGTAPNAYCVCDAVDQYYTGAHCNETAERPANGNAVSFYFGNSAGLAPKLSVGQAEDNWQEVSPVGDSQAVELDEKALDEFRKDLACYLTHSKWPNTSGSCPTTAPIEANETLFDYRRLQPASSPATGIRTQANGSEPALKVTLLIGSVAASTHQPSSGEVLPVLQDGAGISKICEGSPECFKTWDLLPEDHGGSSSDSFPWWLIVIIVVCSLLCCCGVGYLIWMYTKGEEEDPVNKDQLVRENQSGKQETEEVPEYMRSPRSRARAAATARASVGSRPSNGVPLGEGPTDALLGDSDQNQERSAQEVSYM
eukprot:TRINITY_DN2938_c0_g1_i5.p1 TRINITY_DN2938_c0_g1~~TRINITY_DN2938_c0_g1_i5.p1  ORF type:complete len:430 (+),score=72.54 TRINITY_DN2938_c0_g1_i5:135-1424(+)